MKENETEKQEKWRPKINFGLDINQDIKTFMKFLHEEKVAQIKDLKYLEGNSNEIDCKKIAESYFKNFYQKNKEQIESELKQGEQKWQEIKNDFYNKVDELFSNYPWPKGDYLAIGSILNIYPRWIKEKKFTFPCHPGFADWLKIKIIAHEMLHFIEYDYLEKKFNLMPSGPNSVDNSFWQFTENLNVLIENESEWRRLLALGTNSGSRPYPECRAQYEKMKPIWDKNKSIDDLVRNILIK